MTADRDELLDRVQQSLTVVVRRAGLPRWHQRVVAAAGIDLDRAASLGLGRIAAADGMRLSELAQSLAVDGSTASRHASQLESLGLVHREPDPDDARAVRLQVTEHGREVAERLRAARREVLGDALVGWSLADLERLARLGERLAADVTAFTEHARVESP